MSTSDAPPETIVVPPGTVISAGRQTTMTTGAGQVVQGTAFTVQTPSGTSTQVFVPDSILGNIPAIQALFVNKINALEAIVKATP